MNHRAGPRQAFDRRLLRLGRPVRGFLAATVGLGAASAALIVVQAILVGWVVADAVGGAGIGDVTAPLTGLLAVTGLRAVVAWVTEVAAHRSADATAGALRTELLEGVVARRGAGADAGALAAAAGRGIEALHPYFARYLPQAALAAIVPAGVVAVLAVLDPWSAVIVAATLPLIPLFAALTGTATRARMRRRWRAFTDLSSAFVEAVRSLPTLKVFGRSGEAVERFGRLAEAHRTETMATLRVAFLSALALELAATISIAVVAVAVGLRVLGAGLDLRPAVTVLILAPEAYVPLRRLAAEFHAAAEGVEAAGRILDEIDAAPPPAAVSAIIPPPAVLHLSLSGLTVSFPGRDRPVLEGISLDIAPGDYLAVASPSGAGKSTLLGVLMGLVAPSAGRAEVSGIPLADLDLDAWLGLIGWLPQSPHLFAGTIADNVRFGAPEASDDRLEAALQDAGAGFALRLPDGPATVLGERGVGLSAGQRSRVALARALIRDAPILLLDEPTAHLDPITELAVLDTLDELAGSRTIVVATHREAAARRANRVVRLPAPEAEAPR